jgi:long-subunit acyl-CoA synthetase (AMP-forming)
MLTHRNLIATLTSIILTTGITGTKSDAYLAYLPLAHVLELICELMMCMNGVRVK